MDINKRLDNECVPSKWGSKNPIVSDVKPVHKNASGITRRDGNKKTNRGWSEEGIQRFNALCGKANKEDREAHEDVDKELLEKMRPLMETNQSRKRAKLNDPIAKRHMLTLTLMMTVILAIVHHPMKVITRASKRNHNNCFMMHKCSIMNWFFDIHTVCDAFTVVNLTIARLILLPSKW